MKTSISDYQEYKNICLQSALNDSVYENFRQHPEYTRILEHVGEDLGRMYAEEIRKHPLFKPEHLELARLNDTEGTPTLLDYDPPFTNVCPSTLRYLKTALDLFGLFGSLDSMNIVEIGAGYGGQCRVISNLFKPKSYTIVDLLQPLLLAQRYLHGVCNVTFRTEEILKTDQYDLVISNYAFSECERAVQNAYVEKAIKNSKHGYIMFNDISKLFDVDSMTKEQFVEIIKCQESPEIPASGSNVLLHW